MENQEREKRLDAVADRMVRYGKLRREASKKLNQALGLAMEAEFEHQQFVLALRRVFSKRVADLFELDRASLLDALEHDYVPQEIRALIAHLYLGENPRAWLGEEEETP
ncbi:MAG: hypothetical protein ACK4NP_11720 [Parvularculaceae bacterium]